MKRAVAAGFVLLAAGIWFVTSRRAIEAPRKSPASARAERRAYDGAPPVIPHAPFGMACVACHTDVAMHVPGVGLSPAMPHEDTPGMSRQDNCRQCHVFRQTVEVFVESSFDGAPGATRRGERAYPGAPPVPPHGLFMHEKCTACHAGPAAREEVRCTHPERLRCTQCHVPSLTSETYP